MVTREKLYTFADYETYVDQHPEALLELIDGRLVEKMTSEEHGNIVLRIGAALLTWQREYEIAGYATTEATYKLPDDDKNARRPDVSFRHSEDDISTDTSMTDAPDFAVEVKSKRNSYDALRAKAKLYIEHGTRLVWLIYPSRRIVEVYYADGMSELFQPDHTLRGGDVLPNFQLPMSDLFV